ncbi:MAG: hypothetical protein ABWK01_06140 [Infirmifilum sp.]
MNGSVVEDKNSLLIKGAILSTRTQLLQWESSLIVLVKLRASQGSKRLVKSHIDAEALRRDAPLITRPSSPKPREVSCTPKRLGQGRDPASKEDKVHVQG